MKPTRQDFQDLALGAAALIGVTVFAVVYGVGPVPAGAGIPVLIVAPPWSGGAEALALATGARPLGPVRAPFGALAVYDGPVPVARLRALGAWAVRDARRVGALCGDSQT